MKRQRLCFFTVALPFLITTLCYGQQTPTGTYDEELKRYEEFMKRPALFIRTRGIVRFAKTGEVKALKVLSKRYASPENPKDHIQYLVAGIAGEELKSEETVETWKAWMSGYKKAPHSWLWYSGLQVQGEKEGSDPISELALNRKNDVFIRAAAIESLTKRQQSGALLKLIPELLGYTPPEAAGSGTRTRKKKKKKLDKGLAKLVILESCAHALIACKSEIGKKAFTDAATAVIEMLDEKKLPYRTKLVVARALARTFDLEVLHLTSQPWLDILAGKSDEARRDAAGQGGTRTRAAEKGGVSTSSFMGITGTGTRIAFVVDMSDSMLTPLTKAEKDQLKRPTTGGVSKRKGPPTGTGARGQDAEKAKKKKKPDPLDPANLPWDKINNRFEAMRECLKLALRGLNKKTQFCVVLFGTKAGPLIKGKGFIPASKRNIAYVIQQLDKIKTGAKSSSRQYGTLQGNTNIHGGLLEAFRATSGPAIKAYEHVAAPGFLTGADTIFLLSDGAPSWDNFPAQDKREKDINTGDPETGQKLPDQDIVNYYGPYAQADHLTRDLVRMNLFRKARIHCIGIGEADPQLLQQIAEIGGGQFRSISK